MECLDLVWAAVGEPWGSSKRSGMMIQQRMEMLNVPPRPSPQMINTRRWNEKCSNFVEIFAWNVFHPFRPYAERG